MTKKRVFSVRDKASRNINSGVSHLRNFILSQDGLRRLHINQKCNGLIEDLEGYRYPEEIEGKNLKENPLKDGFFEHGCDALRYGIINHFPIKNHKIKEHIITVDDADIFGQVQYKNNTVVCDYSDITPERIETILNSINSKYSVNYPIPFGQKMLTAVNTLEEVKTQSGWWIK